MWARARRPLVLELQPPYTTGSVTLTLGSVSGTFSVAPSASVEGWFLQLSGGTNPEVYRIASHTAASTSFQLDAAFTQTTVTSSTFSIFKLDYDLIGSYITIDADNDRLDFIETGSTVRTGTITHGAYTPAGLATAVAAALNAATVTSNTYSSAYDATTRLFSVTSALNGSGSPIFCPQGAGTNHYRSAWSTLGFDYSNLATSATQTAVYPFSTIVRLTEPGRIYFSTDFVGQDDGKVSGIDALAFDRDWPLFRTQNGTPTHFAVIREKYDGSYTIRMNKYPDKKMRVEFEHIAYPKALQNNTTSFPLIPRKFIRVLEYGASFYVMTDKEDSKADKYFAIAQSTLTSMMKLNRKELQRIGKNFGAVIARPDMMPEMRNYRINNYGYTAGS